MLWLTLYSSDDGGYYWSYGNPPHDGCVVVYTTETCTIECVDVPWGTVVIVIGDPGRWYNEDGRHSDISNSDTIHVVGIE